MSKKPVDTRDNFQIVSDALIKHGGNQKQSGDTRFICCPFPTHGHEEKTPSLGVYMKVDGKIPFGFSHCFGCGSKGSWNVVAGLIGAETIREWEKSTEVSESILTTELEEQLLGDSGTTFKNVLKIMRCEEAQRWPKHLEWRGFDGQLIYKVGGHIIDDDYNKSVGLLFPIKIAGKVRGGVKAVYEKKSKQLGYITMKGEGWVRNYGLFPYMYSEKLLRDGEYDFVVLVEGPRDALRLCSLGIPALAILGATSMSDVKARLVVDMDISTVYVISDNDDGGTVMWKNVQKYFKKTDAEVKRIKLPQEYDKNKKLIKMDPGNAPIAIVKKIVSLLGERHNFIPPTKVNYNSV